MPKVKIAINLDQEIVAELDRLVIDKRYRNRSHAVQRAVLDKLAHLRRARLARECAKLDPEFEKALAEEGMSGSGNHWPTY